MKPVHIAVSPREQFERHAPLWPVLRELFSVEFEAADQQPKPACAGAILFNGTRADAEAWAAAGVRCLAFSGDKAVPARSPEAPVSMRPVAYLDQSFRGRTLKGQKSVDDLHPLQAEAGEEVVAVKGDDVLWVHRSVGKSGYDRLAIDPPVLKAGELAYEYYQRDNCLRLVPLFHFLRQLTPWQRPPLRAQLMFDDPNLHWKTYGCIDFGALARHAEAHNYHASFAMVPFDGWYAHQPTVELFRQFHHRISLLVHGNNHTHAELSQTYPADQRRGMMAQALRRISEFERRNQLPVAQVMAAPHGGCSTEMGSTLLEVGFESASISRWSLMRHTARETWGPAIALALADFIGGGFPIIARFKLALEREVDIYLAALLQKPIVMVGHHEDVGGGLNHLAKFADLINSTGPVKWVDMTEMSRSNFCSCREGEVLHLQPFSRRVRVELPPGVRQIVLHRPWLKPGARQSVRINRQLDGSETVAGYDGGAIAVGPGPIEIETNLDNAVDPLQVATPRTSVWAAARRGFCEMRDRSRPALNLLRGRKASSQNEA